MIEQEIRSAARLAYIDKHGAAPEANGYRLAGVSSKDFGVRINYKARFEHPEKQNVYVDFIG